MRDRVDTLILLSALAAILGASDVSRAGEDDLAASVERGRQALTGRSFVSPAWGPEAYDRAGQFWGPDAPDPHSPAYDRAFRERYGLHVAPFANDGLPMGLRRASSERTGREGFNVDCLECHGSSIGGQSYVGLGNSQLDAIALFDEVSRANETPLPFVAFNVNTVRGTVNAGQMAVFLFSFRNRDLSRRRFPLPLGAKFSELDTPPWWNLKYKKTMYYDGRTDARSTRAIMQFMLGEMDADEFVALEPTFRDIHAYIRSLEPPPYPFPVDRALAERGRALFEAQCARCHGTYGEAVKYPDVLVPLDVIGTDPVRAKAPTKALEDHFNATWFGQEYPSLDREPGYVPPPLRGIWASAPYFHNGSVPTVYQVLRSEERPDRFRRPNSTDFEHYDARRLGWKFEEVPPGPDPDPSLSPAENRRIFDASRFGLDNGGHTFGDGLADDEVFAIIEYLKTL